MLDIWFFVLCIRFRQGISVKGERSRDIIGAKDRLMQDKNKLNIIQLISIKETNDPYIIKDTLTMMKIANSYSQGGMNQLLMILEDTANRKQPLTNLNAYIKSLLG